MTTKTARFLLAIAALFFLASGCGGDDKPASSTPAASAPAEQGGATGSAAPSKVKMPPMPSAEPQNISDELAIKIEMPDFYPSDGPVYPDTAPSKSFVKGNHIQLMFGTQDSVEEVLDFMNQELPRLGWNNADVQRHTTSVSISATKPGRKLSVLVSEIDGGRSSQMTLIAISITGD